MMRILCWMGFHRLYVVRRFSLTHRQVGCRRCGRLWGMEDRTRSYLPWDAELDDMARECYPEQFT